MTWTLSLGPGRPQTNLRFGVLMARMTRIDAGGFLRTQIVDQALDRDCAEFQDDFFFDLEDSPT